MSEIIKHFINGYGMVTVIAGCSMFIISFLAVTYFFVKCFYDFLYSLIKYRVFDETMFGYSAIGLVGILYVIGLAGFVIHLELSIF